MTWLLSLENHLTLSISCSLANCLPPIVSISLWVPKFSAVAPSDICQRVLSYFKYRNPIPPLTFVSSTCVAPAPDLKTSSLFRFTYRAGTGGVYEAGLISSTDPTPLSAPLPQSENKIVLTPVAMTSSLLLVMISPVGCSGVGICQLLPS
jgi:hypothetical protein